MRMGVPASSVNCLEGWGFFVFASRALGMGAIRVPRPAAGIITITFMAGGKYTRRRRESSNRLLGGRAKRGESSGVVGKNRTPAGLANCRAVVAPAAPRV